VCVSLCVWGGRGSAWLRIDVVVCGAVQLSWCKRSHTCTKASINPQPPTQQGAFILLGRSGPSGVGLGLLLAMAAVLLLYIIWRFTEALTGLIGCG